MHAHLGLVHKCFHCLLDAQVALMQGEALEEPAEGHSTADALLELVIPGGHLATDRFLRGGEHQPGCDHVP